MEEILKKAKNYFKQNLPFVIYKKPNDTIVTGFFQQNDNLFFVNDCTEEGFVFASFDGSKIFLIPENQSDIIQEDIQRKENLRNETQTTSPDESVKIQFEELVAKGIQAIHKNEFKKVVLSRKESLHVLNFDLIASFEDLTQYYPSTFVYCFCHPKIGTWLGATPEQLLNANGMKFQTMALAGTQKSAESEEVFWQQKEQQEQQFVTDYIVEKLKNVASIVTISEPYSLKAGSIWHIKTDISGTLNSSSSLQQVIQLLHPTPAVCGFPQDKSKAFILENENYDRTFYTGFLGELNIEDKTDLFVNLRCMEIVNAQAHLFMGCGITKDSIPEKEWEESKNKSATMKKILDF